MPQALSHVTCLLGLLVAFAVNAGPACIDNGQIAIGFADTSRLVGYTKAFTIQAAKDDLKGFCEWNRMDRVVSEDIDLIEEYRGLKAAGDRDKAAEKMSAHTNEIRGIWLSSLAGHSRLKGVGESRFSSLCPTTSLECASSFVSALDQSDYNSVYDVPKYFGSGRPQADDGKIAGACAYVNAINIIGCGNASKDLLKILETHRRTKLQGFMITGVPLIKDALEDHRITKALQRTAVQLWRNVKEKKFKPGANIFSDLTTELKKEGFSEEAAKKKATQVLGAIATGGPNFSMRADLDSIKGFPDSCRNENRCNLNGIFMSAIAEGLVHADTVMMDSGTPSLYSLPAGANFPCDSGKSYYFWMSAALADRLVDMGHSPQSAREAVFMSQIGYQINGNTTNIERTKNLLGMPRYGSVENGIRIDMNLAAAGASFGSHLKDRDGSEDLKLKESLIETMQDSNYTPVNPDEQFDGGFGHILEWVGRTGARTAFDNYQ